MSNTTGTTIGEIIGSEIREEIQSMTIDTTTDVVNQAEEVAAQAAAPQQRPQRTLEERAYALLQWSQKALSSVFLTEEERVELRVAWHEADKLYDQEYDYEAKEAAKIVLNRVQELKASKLDAMDAQVESARVRLGELNAHENFYRHLDSISRFTGEMRRDRPNFDLLTTETGHRITWKWCLDAMNGVERFIANPVQPRPRQQQRSQPTHRPFGGQVVVDRAAKRAALHKAAIEASERPRGQTGQRSRYQG